MRAERHFLLNDLPCCQLTEGHVSSHIGPFNLIKGNCHNLSHSYGKFFLEFGLIRHKTDSGMRLFKIRLETRIKWYLSCGCSTETKFSRIFRSTGMLFTGITVRNSFTPQNILFSYCLNSRF